MVRDRARSSLRRKFYLLILSCWLSAGCTTKFTDPTRFESLSDAAQALVKSAFIGIDEGENVDQHIHVIGFGGRVTFFEGVAGCDQTQFARYPIYLNPRRLSWLNLPRFIQTKVLMKESGISDALFDALDKDHANDRYIDRLYQLVKHYRPASNKPGHFYLLAMAATYTDAGTLDWQRTDVHVPNGYVINLARCLNQKFRIEQAIDYAPFAVVGSVHPADPNALQQVERLRNAGVRYIKWLPNVMHIDPAREAYSAFYRALAGDEGEAPIALLTHTGFEHATDAPHEWQQYGNPVGYRNALAQGVKVVMSHSGYKGHSEHDGTMVPNADLFFEMMDIYPNAESDLSAITFVEPPRGKSLAALYTPSNLLVAQLKRILRESERYSGRMTYGSDYPLPASRFLNPNKNLQGHDFITRDERKALDEIQRFNPLLYDFVLKRTLRLPGEREVRLPDEMFKYH